MGYNTAAIILNDGLHQFEDDSSLGINITNAILMAKAENPANVRVGNHLNAMAVLPPQHADFDQIVLIGGNYIRSVITTIGSPHNVTTLELQEWLLRELASNLGYTVKRRIQD